MSDFIQQWHIECAFRSSDSWVILSPIEQSIKRKIEAVGTPLKNWNININYGIKTGYNDAFIINTEKREEILRNCRTEDERQRTAELIRPYKVRIFVKFSNKHDYEKVYKTFTQANAGRIDSLAGFSA